MARAKKPNKTNKTALKRLRKSNPKGNRKPKIRYNQSSTNHLMTNKSSKAKRRRKGTKTVDATITRKYKNIVSV